MRSPDRHRQAVNLRFINILFDARRIGKTSFGLLHVLLRISDMTEFRLHGNACGMGKLDNFTDFPDIDRLRASRTVDHHGCKTSLNGFLNLT